jgi:hypothetical protein
VSPRDGADGGSVTVESAVVLSVLMLVVATCLAGISCLIGQLRCTDAAREAARLVARGDDAGAQAAVSSLAPAGSSLSIGGGGDLVSATVTSPAAGGLLPGIRLSATVVSARELVPP